MTDPYPLPPRPTDSPDLLVRCVDGPKDAQTLKVRFLKNLSGGEYKRDPGLYFGDDHIPCYRWVTGSQTPVPKYEKYHELWVSGKRMLFLDSKNDIARLIFREHITKELFVDSFRWKGNKFMRVEENSFGEPASAAQGIDIVQCKKLFEV